MRCRKRLMKLLVPVISLVLILSCQFDVPVKEIIAAKTAIEDAKKYDAEKHAPEEIKKAEDLLLQSHDFITSDKADEAKKAANDSLAAALEAETKSLPPYAAEQLQKADDAYAEADLAYSEKFSPVKFTEAGTLIVEAKSLNEKTDYKMSAETSLKAYNLAVAARDESLLNSSAVEKMVSSAENKLSELKASEFSSAAESNLDNAATYIGNAKKGIENKDFKTSYKGIELAKKELDAASELIRKQKVSASIQSLRTELDGMQGKSDDADVKQDMDKALVELNGAEASLEQNNVTDAEIKVEEAGKLIAGSNIKMQKINALAAIEKAEKLLVQGREKDAEKLHKENLDKAETVIGQGKSAIKAEKFGEAVTSAEEAEAIINAVLNSIETASAELAVKTSQDSNAETKTEATDTEATKTEEIVVEKKEEPGKTYTVKWRKKNTDCLWRIAEAVYKDASYWPAIYLANKDQIKDPDLIFPGQKFTIPPKPQKRQSYKEIKEQLKADTK